MPKILTMTLVGICCPSCPRVSVWEQLTSFGITIQAQELYTGSSVCGHFMGFKVANVQSCHLVNKHCSVRKNV